MTQKKIIKLIQEEGLTITDVIDAVIQINGIIGVGKYSLGDDLKQYCYDHKGYKKEGTEQ